MSLYVFSLLLSGVITAVAQDAPEQLPTFGDTVNILGNVSGCIESSMQGS
jgi:hypothetical protein